MTTIQGPEHRRAIQRPPRWYPIPLRLHYRATSGHGILRGFGQTRMMSSQDIIFVADDGLKLGMKAEIAVAWPRLLDNRIRLQLVLQVIVTGRPDGMSQARIVSYDFRTAGPAEVGQRAEPLFAG